MNTREEELNRLREDLGDRYEVRASEPDMYLYCDLGGGFNVEIRDVYTTDSRKRAILYLWYGSRHHRVLLGVLQDVARGNIGDCVWDLRDYAEALHLTTHEYRAEGRRGIFSPMWRLMDYIRRRDWDMMQSYIGARKRIEELERERKERRTKSRS